MHFAEDTASNESTSIDSADVVKRPVPGQLLQLAPTEEIVFRREDGETTGTLTMTNTANCAVAYKVSQLKTKNIRKDYLLKFVFAFYNNYRLRRLLRINIAFVLVPAF